jgi:hypothetical protein
MREIMVDGEVYTPKGSGVKFRELQEHPFEIGKEYYFETATKYYAGTVVAVHPLGVQLENAVWVADTGRFNEFISGKIQGLELEPCGRPFIYFGGAIAHILRPNLLIAVK